MIADGLSDEPGIKGIKVKPKKKSWFFHEIYECSRKSYKKEK